MGWLWEAAAQFPDDVHVEYRNLFSVGQSSKVICKQSPQRQQRLSESTDVLVVKGLQFILVV